MKRISKLFLCLSVVGPLFLSVSFTTPAHADPSGKTIVSHTAEIDGVTLHYMTAGHGAALILLHGYAETSRMWKPIIPLLAEKSSRFPSFSATY